MENLQGIKKSIDSAENLQSIVSTMKAYASSNIIQFQNAAKASMEYRRVLDRSLHVILSRDEQKVSPGIQEKGGSIHIIFGSDHGLAGRFNERIAAYAVENIKPEASDIILAVGQQVPPRVEGRLTISGILPVPQTEEGIASMVQSLLFEIDELQKEQSAGRIMLYFNKPVEHASFREQSELLYPIDLEEIAHRKVNWKSNTIPTYFMPKKTLLSDLMQQYFFITLYRTYCYSLASENASRLASMQAAEKNIDERLDELKFKYRSQRQNQITEELSDVTSGFKAIKKSKQAGINPIE